MDWSHPLKKLSITQHNLKKIKETQESEKE